MIFRLKGYTQTEADSKKDARQEGQNRQRGQHGTPLYIRITVIAYMVLAGLSLMETEQSRRGI